MTQNSTITTAPLDGAKPKIELAVIDIDGTLFNSSSQLSKRVETALKAAVAQGVKIVFATGKTRSSAAALLQQLGIEAPGIYNQGCVVYNSDGGIRSQTTLNDSLLRQFITYAEDRGFAVALYSASRILIRTSSKQIEDNMRHYHEVAPEAVGPLQNILGSLPIHKAIAMGETRAITGLRWQLNMQFSAQAKIVQAGVPEMLEVVPLGVSKGSALKRLASELKVAPENIMAIGDAENDIEMIQFAGIGVAMGNADEPTKAAAKYVVASNNEDGLAEALERFVIIKPPSPPPVPVVEAETINPPAIAESAAPVAPSTVTADAKADVEVKPTVKSDTPKKSAAARAAKESDQGEDKPA